MKAAVFRRGGEPWVIERVDDPVPGPGEMVLKVSRCGICGSDVHRTAGEGASFPCESVLGHEYSGEVVALGREVEGFGLGDLVTALPVAGCGRCDDCRGGYEFLCRVKLDVYMGGFAEYVRVAARRAVRLPAVLSAADGALVEPLAVGLHAVALSAVAPGARALVLGAGPIGLATIFALHRRGVRKIAAASRSLRRAHLAEAMGAASFVLTGSDEGERIAAALWGAPDVVFECIGVAGALDHSVRLVRPGGLVVSLGDCVVPDPFSVTAATAKQARLIFSLGYDLAEFAEAADALAGDVIDPRQMISEVVSLAAAPAKIAELQRGATQTKVQVDPWLA